MGLSCLAREARPVKKTSERTKHAWKVPSPPIGSSTICVNGRPASCRGRYAAFIKRVNAQHTVEKVDVVFAVEFDAQVCPGLPSHGQVVEARREIAQEEIIPLLQEAPEIIPLLQEAPAAGSPFGS